MLTTKFWLIWQSGFRGEDFRNRTIRNTNCGFRGEDSNVEGKQMTNNRQRTPNEGKSSHGQIILTQHT